MHIFNPASNKDTPKKNDYRPDIDGLRAIAVLSVVVFHAFPSLLQGGFIGVDIFFVISGYLISKHIWDDLRTESFSIKKFYARRVRRIFPALAVVFLACLLLGWVILTPGEYESLGRHIFAGSLFLSNFLFWKESGYFDSAADTKPLLHLWSLGIEEQFYIVWPLFLAIFWRFNKYLRWGLLGVIGISLAYSLVIVRRDVVADFYSPFTRFWELALGAFVAYVTAQKLTVSAPNRSIISWFGLGLIVTATIIIKNSDPFPGALALLPTVGAALLICAGEAAWVNRHLLSNRLLVWVGLISYPLYLWHWPLLSFARIIESGTPSVEVRMVMVAAGFILAWPTYKLIERPVRARSKSSIVVWILCLAVFSLGIAGFIVKSAHGYKLRQSGMFNGDPSTMVIGKDRAKLLPGCGIPEAKKLHDLTYCMKSGPAEPHYAVLGDSKAEALFYGLVRESTPDMQWMIIGSVHLPDLDVASSDHEEKKRLLALKTLVENQSIKVVLVTEALRGIFPPDSESGFIPANKTPSPKKLAAYSNAIQQLEHSGKRVVFVIDSPTFPDPTSCISGGLTPSAILNQFLRRKENPLCRISYAQQLARTKPYLEFVNELKRLNPGLIIYDPTPLLCDIPNNVCTILRDGKFLYSYGDHISDYANSMIARDMLPVIRKLAPMATQSAPLMASQTAPPRPP